MKYEISHGSMTIFLAEEVMSTLCKFRQKGRFAKEAGGIILGQVSSKGIHILTLSEPTSADKRWRCFFKRDIKTAQEKINDHFESSGHKTIYLGEWHTHPENRPRPSAIDRKMIKDNFRENDINLNYIFLIIGGLKEAIIQTYSKTGWQSSSFVLENCI